MKILIREASDLGDDPQILDQAIVKVHEAMEETSPHVVRIEIYLGRKMCLQAQPGRVMCMLDARLKSRIPVAVMEDGETMNEAVDKAVRNLRVTVQRLSRVTRSGSSAR